VEQHTLILKGDVIQPLYIAELYSMQEMFQQTLPCLHV